MRLACALLVACAPAVAVHAPGVEDQPFTARWVVTHPELAGVDNVAVVHDDVYVLDCGIRARLAKVVNGEVAWTQVLDGACPQGDHRRALAANERGPVVAIDERVIGFDRDGAIRWERELARGVREVVLSARLGGVAACSETDGALLVIELDDAGHRDRTHELSRVFGARSCSYDARGDLWVVLRAGKELVADGVRRDVSPGTWAVELDGTYRFVALSREEHAQVQPMPEGFVVEGFNDKAMWFVDLHGAQRWRFAHGRDGCSVYPTAIAATPTWLLAAIPILCDQRGGSTTFGDLEIEDLTQHGDDKLGERTVLVAFDTKTRHARLVRGVASSPQNLKYALLDHGVLAYGHFEGELGLGTSIESTPPEYRCKSDLPEDAQSWSSYDSKTPSCDRGFHLRIGHPTWPFVAALGGR
jgi:hypothetical protein